MDEMKKSIFRDILSMNVKELKEYCYLQLKKLDYKEIEWIGNETDDDPGYLFAKGKIPILLVAHLDRQNNGCNGKIDVSLLKENNNIWTHEGQICGDDRCGVYLILELIRKYRASVMFNDKEECSPYGRTKFKESKYIDFIKKEIKYMCQIDRRGNNDIIYYDSRKERPEKEIFKNYIKKLTGYEENQGSFTDIVDLTNWTGVSSFNISCGYYNEHHSNEYIDLNDVDKTYYALDNLLNDYQNAQFYRN